MKNGNHVYLLLILDIKSNPDDYSKINKFFDNKGGKNGNRKNNIFNKLSDTREDNGFQSQKKSYKNFNVQRKFGSDNEGGFRGGRGQRGGFGGRGQRGGFGGRGQRGGFGGRGQRGGFGGRGQRGGFGGRGQRGGFGGRGEFNRGGFGRNKQPKQTRPGKVSRMKMRNKKNSMK